MGEVWEAHQLHPVKRTVALKLIKLGMDTRQVVARFELERQALAMMTHPGIAAMHDAGTTKSGRPYFVMELVAGLPIHRYCDERHLSPVERLRLFRDVCLSVQHAHQKGVIHRDLKPSNVLVVEKGSTALPKIIDFGVAKATAGHLADETLYTAAHQILGTPTYMAPEQAEQGANVDVRADIYALGVVLYELLTGTTPFEAKRLKEVGAAEMLRIIKEEEPEKPSTRITSLGERMELISSSRRTDPSKFQTLLRRDLDWIVMMALAKEPERRYASANGLAEDVARYLDDEPVLAAPPSSTYRVRRFVRRYRMVVLSTIGVFLLLVVATTVSLRQAFRAIRAEERESKEKHEAQIQAKIATETVEFLQNDLLRQASPLAQPDPDIRLRTVLDRAAIKLKDRFQGQEEVKAMLLTTLGETYSGIGAFEKAAEHLNMARDYYVNSVGIEDARTQKIDVNLADGLSQQRRYAEALPIHERLWRTRLRQLGAADLLTLTSQRSYGNSLSRLGRTDESVAILESLVDIWDTKDADFFEVAPKRRQKFKWMAYGTLGDAYFQSGQLKMAENLFEEVLVKMRQFLGLKSPHTLITLNNYAAAIANQGRLEEALPLLEEALTLSREIHGNQRVSHLRLVHDVGGANWALGNRQRGMALQREAYEAFLSRLGLKHTETLKAAKQFGEMLLESGKTEEGANLAREMLRHAHETYGGSHEITNWAFDRVHEHFSDWETLLDPLSNAAPWSARRAQDLVPQGASWRYYDDGDLTTNWMDGSFGDQSWLQGTAPLGYGENDIVTTIGYGPDADAKQAASAFRCRFHVENREGFEKIRVRIRRDDGAAIYLNGTLVAHEHLAMTDKRCSLAAYATAIVGGLEERLYYTTEIDPALLEEGENLVAVQVHQCNGGSSDFFFDLQLEGLVKSE